MGDLVIIAGGEKVMRLRARKGEILHESVTSREMVLRFPAAQMDGWAALIEKFGEVRRGLLSQPHFRSRPQRTRPTTGWG